VHKTVKWNQIKKLIHQSESNWKFFSMKQRECSTASQSFMLTFLRKSGAADQLDYF